MGPTLVWYLRGAGAGVTWAWEVAAASTEPTAGLPEEVVAAGTTATAATMAGVAVVSAGSGLGLDSPIGEGEEWRT